MSTPAMMPIRTMTRMISMSVNPSFPVPYACRFFRILPPNLETREHRHHLAGASLGIGERDRDFLVVGGPGAEAGVQIRVRHVADRDLLPEAGDAADRGAQRVLRGGLVAPGKG